MQSAFAPDEVVGEAVAGPRQRRGSGEARREAEAEKRRWSHACAATHARVRDASSARGVRDASSAHACRAVEWERGRGRGEAEADIPGAHNFVHREQGHKIL